MINFKQFYREKHNFLQSSLVPSQIPEKFAHIKI